jgi:hypothetical protein
MSLPAGEDDGPSESEWLDLEKRRLELEKLRAEIAQANAPWWTRAGYIGTLVPIVIAVVGFVSALASGFFDSERAQLKAEVDALAARRDQLLAANENTQKKIDDAYLLLRLTASEAEYAIGHITSLEPMRDGLAKAVEEVVRILPDDESAAVGELLSQYTLFSEIAAITESSLAEVQLSLTRIPASPWARELKPTLKGLIVPDRALLEAPDGRFYDPAAGRFLDPAELGS